MSNSAEAVRTKPDLEEEDGSLEPERTHRLGRRQPGFVRLVAAASKHQCDVGRHARLHVWICTEELLGETLGFRRHANAPLQNPSHPGRAERQPNDKNYYDERHRRRTRIVRQIARREDHPVE
jgi:hypothetical protein